MSRCTVTLTANAGLMLTLGRSTVLVDALHDRQSEGWSTLGPARWQTLQGLLPPEGPALILFTHRHNDHYSYRMAAQAKTLWPAARQVLPGPREPREETILLPGLTVHAARLPHEGEQFAATHHWGYVLEQEGFRVLLTGDCALCARELADFAGRCGPIDLAVMDFPWLTLRRGREFLLERVRPGRVLIDHLPFAEDDLFGYRAAARRAAAAWDGPPLTLLTEPFQRVDIE